MDRQRLLVILDRFLMTGFQKLIDRCPQSGTADGSAVFGVGKALDCLHLRYVLRSPDDPNLFRALLLIELKPTLLRNLNLLIFPQKCRAVVGRLRWKQNVKGRCCIGSHWTLVQQIETPALCAGDVQTNSIILLEINVVSEPEGILIGLTVAILLHRYPVAHHAFRSSCWSNNSRR